MFAITSMSHLLIVCLLGMTAAPIFVTSFMYLDGLRDRLAYDRHYNWTQSVPFASTKLVLSYVGIVYGLIMTIICTYSLILLFLGR